MPGERWWYDPQAGAVKDENGLHVAQVHTSAPEARGHMLAAAPELAEALETFMRLGTMDNQEAIDAARLALAHARGEEP